MIEIIPAILEERWEEIAAKLTLVAPHAPWVQIDIADGTLTPSVSFCDFVKFTAFPQVSLEAHLMVASPEKYIRPLVDAGFKRLVAHVEAHDPRLFLDQARFEMVEVGIAIDGATEFSWVEPFLEEVDCVLVMMYEAGKKGQPFQPENLEKIKAIRSYFPDLPISSEGGLDETTARLVKEAGASRLVSTSYIFHNPREIAQSIERLKDV